MYSVCTSSCEGNKESSGSGKPASLPASVCSSHRSPLPSTRHDPHPEFFVHHFIALFTLTMLISKNSSVELCGLFNLIHGIIVQLFFSYLFSVISLFRASSKTIFSLQFFVSVVWRLYHTQTCLFVVYIDNLTCVLNIF